MRMYWEKIKRKTARLYHGIVPPAPAVVDLPTLPMISGDHLSSLNARFPLHFHPYRFISPEHLRKDIHFSDQNIPLRHKKDTRAYQNPVFAAYWGLTHLHQYAISRDASLSLKEALRMHDVLKSLSRESGQNLFLDFTVDLPRFGLRAPWTSGLAQGLAASLCTRLFYITGDKNYSDHALGFAGPMTLPVRDGGCMQSTPEGLPWIEEYPGSPPSHVLNGFLFALIALIETGSLDEKRFLLHINNCLGSLVQTCAHYRAGRYIRYDRLHKNYCNPHYMGLHVLLFYHLHTLSHAEMLLMFAREFAINTDWHLYARSVHHDNLSEITSWVSGHLR